MNDYCAMCDADTATPITFVGRKLCAACAPRPRPIDGAPVTRDDSGRYWVDAVERGGGIVRVELVPAGDGKFTVAAASE